MTDVDISIACQAYDRVQALQGGAVTIQGCHSRFFPLRTEETFHRAYNGAQFEVTELSMSSYILSIARDISEFIAIPVFPSRMFRHSALYIRTDRGIEQPRDLHGKIVGVPEYQMTAALWVRGMLADEYEVPANAMRWRTGGLEQPGRKEKFGLRFPEDLEVVPIGDERTLSVMLECGEIDALVSARAPSCFVRNHPQVTRLFGDYRAAEEAYFRKTGLFPIMHVIGIRRDVAERYAWLPASVAQALETSKALCMEAMYDVGAVNATLPWLNDDLARTVAVMGRDYWPYGVAANSFPLEAMLRYSYEQGLSPRKVTLEELFAPGTYAEFKI